MTRFMSESQIKALGDRIARSTEATKAERFASKKAAEQQEMFETGA